MWRKWISQCSFGYWFDKLNQCRVDIARLIGFGVDSICWFHRWVVRCACPYLNNYIMRSFNSHTDTQDVWFRTRAKFRYVKLLYCEWMRVAQTCGAFYWASLIEWKEMQKQSKKLWVTILSKSFHAETNAQKNTHTANWKAIMQLPFSLTAPRHVTKNDKSRIVFIFFSRSAIHSRIVFFFFVIRISLCVSLGYCLSLIWSSWG